jgi:hypothetical protein
MLIKYLRPVLLIVMLLTMSIPSAFAAGKDRRHKRCVENCKFTHKRAKDACHNMRKGERKQCKKLADDVFRTCKDGCPR